MLEQFEKQIETEQVAVENKSIGFNQFFSEAIEAGKEGVPEMWENVTDGVAKWAGIISSESTVIQNMLNNTSVSEIVEGMLNGTEVDGMQTLGLDAISKWKIHPDFELQNLKQHAGYAAEVISTAKENIAAELEGTGITTFRADDRPDLYAKNDQYVDKIRMDASGSIIDKIQVKFVGKDGGDCLSKLASSKYDKYFTDGKVNKIEIPSDYYDQIMSENMITEKISGLQQQLERVTANGNTEAAEHIQGQIDRYNQIGEMLERSNTSSVEAMEAVQNPASYVKRIFENSVFQEANAIGIKSAEIAGGITFTISTIDNVQKCLEGEETALEAIGDVALDTLEAGALGYGTAFVSVAVSEAMKVSGHQLLSSLANANVPATVISVGVSSMDAVMDFAQGEITGAELVEEIAGNGVGVAGSMAGTAILTTVVGAPAITGIVGGMIGYTVASAAYGTAIEIGAEYGPELAEVAVNKAQEVLDLAKESIPESFESVKDAVNNLAGSVSLPIHFA